MTFSLFVDASKDLKYYFSNGVMVHTHADGEYRHVVHVEVPDDVVVTRIEVFDYKTLEMVLTPDSVTIFTASSAGWMHEIEMSFQKMIE